jgi:uroporphyrinogen decarboxylase
MMTRREVIKTVLDGNVPPYTPWSFKFTVEAKELLTRHYRTEDLDDILYNHILMLGADIGFFDRIGENFYRDVFGAVWDRSIDKDIGNITGCVISEPSLRNYTFPDPLDRRIYVDIPICSAFLK